MVGLLSIIRKAKRKERSMRILMVGLDNAGKTTIVKRAMGEDISQVSPTLGFNIKTLFYKGYSLHIWDVGGQKSLRPFWRNHFEETDAMIWVVDSNDRLRIEDCKIELFSILQEERLAGASLLIFANKQDIPGAMTTSELSTALDLASLRTHSWHIQACSAQTGEGISRGFEWLIQDVAFRLYGAPVKS
ncbi:ARF/SAR superfamily [Cystobasidium minutum MCA 4210]|uniref:ARF/SAR superfamily n=1 Tax=Cystobasidium minutum MCA 4210 TaxID=1397322 RepID=UPI0034CF441D|eukprot:jgi/Rhomi1/59409/CE59408_156